MCKLELYTMVKQLIAMADSCLTIVNFILTKKHYVACGQSQGSLSTVVHAGEC